MDLNSIPKTLEKLKAQAAYEGMGRIIVWVPKPVPDKVLQDIFPGAIVKVIVDIKPDTKERLRHMFAEKGCTVEYKGRHLTITTDDADPGVWDALCEILSNDGFLETWQMGDRKYDSVAVKAIASNPRNTHGIDAIDLGLLHKALDKAQTIDDILASI